MAANSSVEFGHIKFDDSGNIITTSHNPSAEGGGNTVAYEKAVAGSKINEKIHSHPGDGDPSPADKNDASYWKSFP